MKNFAFISVGLSTIGLALGYSLSELWAWTPLVIVGGLLGLAGRWYDGEQYTSVGLILRVGAAAWGVWQGAGAGWMLIGVVAALVAWDLDHFSQQLKWGGQVENVAEIKYAHLRRLFIIAGLGLLLAGVALSIRIELHFGWALVLGLVAMAGLSWMIHLTRSENN